MGQKRKKINGKELVLDISYDIVGSVLYALGIYTVSPFWLSYYFEFYLDVDFAPHTLDTDICKMSDWLPHKMCTQHQKYQKGQLIFLVECHKVGSAKLRKEEHGTEEKKK